MPLLIDEIWEIPTGCDHYAADTSYENWQARPIVAEDEPQDDAPKMVKMSVLARMSGVPSATIKHYVREGLLPEPHRPNRNMAYYDTAVIPRIQRIKELQRTRYLPLKVIKQVLDESELSHEDETIAAVIARAMSPGGEGDQRTRQELVHAGMPEEQLEWLKAIRVIAPVDGRKTETYAGDDLELLRVLGAARRAGLAPEMLPVTILQEYASALRALVRAELKMFREGVLPTAGEDLSEITQAATELSERLVVLLRRKLLLPTLRDLHREAPSSDAEPEG